MTNDFPFVAINTFTPALTPATKVDPIESYLEENQEFIELLASEVSTDEITGTEQQVEAEPEAEPEVEEVAVEPRGITVTALAVMAGISLFAAKHFITFVITVLTYLDADVSNKFLSN